MDAVATTFDRKPYTVTYYDKGEKKTLRRTPPQKLHEALPTDRVELTRKHSDDFKDGNTYEVSSISPRNPNVLQLKNKNGETAFVPYFDTNLMERVATRPGVNPLDDPVSNRYLEWP